MLQFVWIKKEDGTENVVNLAQVVRMNKWFLSSPKREQYTLMFNGEENDIIITESDYNRILNILGKTQSLL